MHEWLRCAMALGDNISLLWCATVDDDHCDCLSLRH